MKWLNANTNIVIEESLKQNHYMTYGGSEMNSNCFKKITYKNVYNNIDIEYIIPEDKETGIKYNVVLNTGANIEDVKIVYEGDCDNLKLRKNGDVDIKTQLSKITEHAPVSFYSTNKAVKTKFKITDNVLSFDFPDGYNSNETLIIDPWVSTITTLTTTNSGFDVDYDFGGNLYVYGGSAPCQIAKYNSVGALQWTFQGVVNSISWSSSFATTYCGNFVVSKTIGKTYVGCPWENAGGTRIIRLDANGNYDNYVTTPVSTFLECWEMSYQCTNDRICGFGGASTGDIATVNDPSPNLTTFFSGSGDVNCATFDNAGDLFIHYTGNKIKKVNSTLTNTVWTNVSTFSNLNYWTAKTLYVGGGVTSQGFNCLAVNNNYLYFYDGFNIAAYNKSNGNLIASTTIPGYTAKKQGGIDVDECDNVYIGGDGNILCYHFNGTTFSSLGNIPLNTSTAFKNVYDLKLNRNTKLLYLSGSGFTGVYSAVNSNTCSAFLGCFATIPPTGTVLCSGSNAYLTMSNPNNLINPSYSIQPNGQIQSTPVFTVSPTINTSYTLFVTGTDASSAIVTQTALITVTIAPVAVLSPSLTNGTCANPTTSSVNLNVVFTPSGSPNYTTTWSPVPSTVTTVNSGTAAGLAPGINNVTLTTSDGCITIVSFTVPPIPLPADFIITNSGGTYTLTCSVPNIVLTTSITNGNILTYTWFPSCTGTVVGNSMNFNQPCTGQVVGTSSTGCTHTETYTIYQDLTSPTIVVTPTVLNITCGVSPTTFTGTSNLGPNVTTNWFQVVGTNTVYVGVAGGTVNIFQPGQPGIYWFESIYNITGCKKTMSVQVTASVGVPIFTVTSPTNFTIGCASTSITSMQVSTVITSPVLNVPVNYAFVVPPGTAIPVYTVNPNLNNITIPGTYVVYVKDLTNNCVSSESISIIQNTIAPNIDFIQPLSILSCKDPSMVLNGISSNTNVTITWTVPAIPSSSIDPTPNATVVINPAITNATNNVTTIGFYTVGAVDNNNQCRATKTVQINQDIRLPKFTISALTNSVINCMNPDVVIVPIVTPSLAVALVPTYIWYPPVGPGVPGTQFNTTSAGSHTSISTSVVNGCTYIATYVVAADFNPPAIDALSTPFILDCNANPTVALFPTITGTTTGFTYSWTVPAGALTSNLTNSLLTSNMTGIYIIVVTNTINGCVSQGAYQVVEGNIKADFVATPDYGFAPLSVTFNNTSSTSTGASSIISTWGYGNGAITQTVYNTSPTSATYTSSGTYSIILTVQKGTCIDTAMHTIIVELPSKLEIPNVFTPNGDKANDIFRLKATNLTEVYIIIFDRWGNKVYELTSETGNFAWDGKNQTGKDCADGVYFYIIKATGKDKQTYDLKGNVSLFR